MLREAGGPVGRAALTAYFGWKGDRLGVRLESRSGEPVRSPKNKSGRSQKADTQSSEPRVHCPEECLKAKVVSNCRYTIAATRERLKLFFAQLFLYEGSSPTLKHVRQRSRDQKIIEGRRPTMRHVSRTHRVALDWSFDRINLEPKIQVKYVDTTNPTRRHSNQRKLLTK